jgi:hypothetical protein
MNEDQRGHVEDQKEPGDEAIETVADLKILYDSIYPGIYKVLDTEKCKAKLKKMPEDFLWKEEN